MLVPRFWCKRPGLCAHRIAELNGELFREFCIHTSNITAFTTDTAANQKKAIRLMGVPWLAYSNHVLELSTGVVVKHAAVKEVKNVYVATVNNGCLSYVRVVCCIDLRCWQRKWYVIDRRSRGR